MANEPDLTQRLTVTFENTTQPMNAEFGVISQIENGKVLYGTTAQWNSTPELVAREGWLYIYSDYKQDEQGNDIAGTKVGDGTTLLSALPFTDKLLYLHVDDSTRHITQEERELWNKSVNALHWLGITTTELTDGASTNPITIDGDSVTAVNGDIVSYNDKEFIFNGSVWQEFGDLSDVYTKSQVDTLLGDKMNKTNPEGVGSFSMNRKPETTVGTGSATVGDGNTASGNYTFAEGFANTASGTCAHAEGNVVQATGAFSHAEGQYSIANNKCAHAEGYRTKSSGSLASHAEGSYTTASEHSAHAEGYTTVASGQYSHAEGRETTASAYATHTEGLHTTASNNYAHAEGCATSASNVASHAEGYETTASGHDAHAEGNGTTASGSHSHAEGYDTIASGSSSHAEGYYTEASGDYSHAEGNFTLASGEYSHAEGHHTIANHSSQHVFGKYNIPDDSEEPAYSEGNYVEIVGNGYFDYEEEEAVRSNIRTLDWNGNEMIAGDLTYNGNTSLTQAINDVNTRIDNLPEPMVFKGSLGAGGTITELPVDGTADKGDTYKVITAGTYAGQSADVGDTFICDSKTMSANTWTLIPSGDEPSGTVTSIKIQTTSPISIDSDTAITTSGTRTISHAKSGVTAGDYGDSSAQTPAVGGTFKVPYVRVNDTGHIIGINAHNVTMPVPTATDVTYDNTTSGLSATTAQSAIDEIKSSVYTKTETDTAITGLIDDTSTVNNKAWSSEKISTELVSLLPVDEVSGAVANFDTEFALPLIGVKSAIVATGGGGTPQAPIAVGGVSEVSVVRCGKNLYQYDANKVKTGTTTAQSTRAYLDLGLKGTNQFTISANIKEGETPTNTNINISKIRTDGLIEVLLVFILIGNTTPTTRTVTINQGERLIFTMASDNPNAALTNIPKYDFQIEVGTTQTNYSPYNGTTAIINLGGTYYGGYFKQDNAGHRQLVVTHSDLIDLNTLTFYRATFSGNSGFYADLPNGLIKGTGSAVINGLCTSYKVTSQASMPEDKSCRFYSHTDWGGFSRIAIRDDDTINMTGEEFKAYVTGKICYEIQEPQTVTLPDGEPIIALNGVNNVWSDTNGDTTVKYKLGIQAYIDKKIAEVQALVL